MTRGVVQPERYRRGMGRGCPRRADHYWHGEFFSCRAVTFEHWTQVNQKRTHRLERRWAAAEIRREVAA